MKTPPRIPFLFLPLLPILALAQQPVNGGFEDWSDVFAFETIDAWRTGNWQIPGVATTTKVPGPSGLYAAHLETEIAGNDTVFGFIMHGNFVNDIPTEGVPYNSMVQYVEGWYRCDLQPGDSAVLVVVCWVGGSPAVGSTWLFGGSQPAWTQFQYTLGGPVPALADSVALGVASSNPFGNGAMDGSWIEVDAIELTTVLLPSSPQLPNNDMELWSDVVTEEPDDWFTFNPALAGVGLTPVTKSLLANSGNHSIRIETLDLGGDTLPGVLSNGPISFTGTVAGAPFTDMPVSLDGFFMYEPVGSDTAMIYAQFNAGGTPVGGAVYGFSGAVPAWTAFSAPVTLALQPDTLILVVFSGANPGSALYLDDLSFDIPTVVNEHGGPRSVLFPNPVHDELHLACSMPDLRQVRILDALGRTVLEPMSDVGRPMPMDVARLKAGHYLVELTGDRRVERLPFIKQ